jgi:hypothetical protein
MTPRRGRPPGPPKTPRRTKSKSKVDKILGLIPAPMKEDFIEWCWTSPTLSDIAARLKDYVETYPERFAELEDFNSHVSINCCHDWYRKNFPVGDEIKEFNQMLRLYQGVEHEKIPQHLLVRAIKLTNMAMEKLSDEQLADVPSEQILTSLSGLLREIRSLSKSVELYKKQQTVHEARMQAVQIAIAAIINTFKDQENEDVVKCACIDALLEVERWSKADIS